jgi:hypothetical protein
MRALLRLRLPRSTDFGKAEPSRRCIPKPVRSTRRMPDNGVTAVADGIRAGVDYFPASLRTKGLPGSLPYIVVGNSCVDPKASKGRPVLACAVRALFRAFLRRVRHRMVRAPSPAFRLPCSPPLCYLVYACSRTSEVLRCWNHPGWRDGSPSLGPGKNTLGGVGRNHRSAGLLRFARGVAIP